MSGYCNCIKDSKQISLTKFRIVQTCSEGICEDCGHYTLRSPKKMNYVSTKREVIGSKYKEEVESMLKKGMAGKLIAKKLGILQSTVSRIKNG